MVHTGGMATFWYPKAFALRIPFHANFNVNAAATGLTYGLVAGQQASIARDAANVAIVVNFKDAAAGRRFSLGGLVRRPFGGHC
jgi:hypothetical protein